MPGTFLKELQPTFKTVSAFGVQMKYYVEQGTFRHCRQRKNAAAFLDETFVVVSGDALTDISLTRQFPFIGRKGSRPLVLTKVPNPLSYGVVLTDQGAESQFLEKPHLEPGL